MLPTAFFPSARNIDAYELTPGGVVSRFGLFAAPEFVVRCLLLFLLFLAAPILSI